MVAMDSGNDILATALHTAARRYCDRQYRHWADLYDELDRTGRDRDGAEYTPEALGLFPRYNVLNAIRVEIERLEPNDLGEFDATLDILLAAVGTAEDDFTRKPIGEIDAAAMMEERESLSTYLRGLDAAQLRHIEPLPYRRVLDASEAKATWAKLSDRWSIEPGSWFPLAELTVPGTAAFPARYFEDAVGATNIRRLLLGRRISRVWEFREGAPEYGPHYLLDLDFLDPVYNGSEGYWSSEDMDWIIYASHESSVTVGGWMLDEVKRIWPAWSDHIWESPSF